MAEGGHPAKAWMERPTLNTDYVWLRDAYYVLTRSRQLGPSSEYFIPLTEYHAYCQMKGIVGDKVDILLEVITRVDSVLLGERMEEVKRSLKGK